MEDYRNEGDTTDLEKKIQQLEMERLRLETHAYNLQKQYTRLLREFQRLKQPPLIVGTVLEVLPDGLVIVKHPNGNEFVVPALSNLLPHLKPGTRVGMSQQNLAIVSILPDYKDVRARAFEVVERPNVRYSDIGGLERQIQELRDVVELPLKNPDLFKELGIEPPKGVLLYGPPGTGKTLLAKAVAGESNATFIHVVGSELVQKFIGEGAKLVRDVFKLAREKAPSIIFIDEIDAIAGKRIDSGTGGDREVHRTLIQLLAELDGFRPLEGVAVIAATNRIDIIDPALLRPGRFDRIIYVPLPDQKGREEIFKVHLSKVKTKGKIDYRKLASLTPGFSGADIRAVVTEAGMKAAKEGRSYITMKDLLSAIDKLKTEEKKEYSSHFG